MVVSNPASFALLDMAKANLRALPPDPLLEASLRSARDVAHPDAGFVLILPVHPPTEHTTDALPLNHPLALLNGDWSDVLRLVESCGWAPQSVHVERVHRSLSRLILHARCAPQG